MKAMRGPPKYRSPSMGVSMQFGNRVLCRSVGLNVAAHLSESKDGIDGQQRRLLFRATLKKPTCRGVYRRTVRLLALARRITAFECLIPKLLE